MEARGEVWARARTLGIISMEMTFKAVMLDEITKETAHGKRSKLMTENREVRGEGKPMEETEEEQPESKEGHQPCVVSCKAVVKECPAGGEQCVDC